MKSKFRIEKDGHKIIAHQPPQPGKPHNIDVFLDIRGGLVWPRSKTPGYFCLFGLLDEPTLTEKKPLVLLTEVTDPQLERLFSVMVERAVRWFCSWVFITEDEGFENNLYRFIQKRNVKGETKFYAAPESSSNPEYTTALIKQWRRDRALKIPRETALGREIIRVKPEHLKGAEDDNFYAIKALNYVLTSFEIYPYAKPKRDPYGKWSGRQPGYG